MRPQRFRNRTDAGRRLAEKLAAYADRPDVLVLALPRGGVPVGFEVARALGAPFDVFLVRKLGVPGYEELAMGAVATGGVRVLNDEIVRGLGISEHEIDAAVEPVVFQSGGILSALPKNAIHVSMSTISLALSHR